MVSQQVLEYIKSQIAKGIDRDTIKTNLTASKWTAEDIQSAFNQIDNPAPSINDGTSSQQANQNTSASPTLRLNRLAMISLILSLLNIVFILYLFFFTSSLIEQPAMIFVVWGQFLVSILGVYASVATFQHKSFGVTLLKFWAAVQIPIVQIEMANSVLQVGLKQFLDLTFYIGVFAETTKVSIGINFVGVLLFGIVSRIKKK